MSWQEYKVLLNCIIITINLTNKVSVIKASASPYIAFRFPSSSFALRLLYNQSKFIGYTVARHCTDWAILVQCFSNCINLFGKLGTKSVRDIRLISGAVPEYWGRMVTSCLEHSNSSIPTFISLETGTSTIDWTQLSRLFTQGWRESRLQNVVLKNNDVYVQKVSNYMNL
jgi:hypothetical protein